MGSQSPCLRIFMSNIKVESSARAAPNNSLNRTRNSAALIFHVDSSPVNSGVRLVGSSIERQNNIIVILISPLEGWPGRITFQVDKHTPPDERDDLN
jgi:hypothetical protein